MLSMLLMISVKQTSNQINVRFTDEDYAKILRMAEDEDRSPTSIVRNIVRKEIENLEA